MKHNLIPILGALVLGLATATAVADSITLKDGRVIQGQLMREGNNFRIQPDQGKAFKVPVSDVVSVVLGAPPTTQQAAGDQWQATLYEISQQSDLPAIIADIQAYMKQYPDSPDNESVGATLAQYEQYQAQGYIKFADKWMTPADRDKLKVQAQSQLSDAIGAYQKGDMTQAQSGALAAQMLDPTNVNSMIVAGAAEFRLNEFQNALTEFNKALALDPNNVAALNDSAVASYRTNLQPHALLVYQSAINRSGGNRMLLDNIASALINYQGDQTNPLFINLQASFTNADQQMQTIMAQQGLYRFAASWITADQRDQLNAQEQQFQQKKLALQTSYDDVVQQLQQATSAYNDAVNTLPGLQSQLNQDENAEYDAESDNPFVDTSSYDQAIADDQSAISQAQATINRFPDVRAKFETQMNSMQNEAQVLMQQDPAKRYNGTQVMMMPGDVSNIQPLNGANLVQMAQPGQNPQ
ncbi:MAG TPA: hypothetical protein VMG59_13025 [Phycisphaerae bacterium]|nr:hypothetical protein [Phycisphaerae bacterium]